MGTPIMEFAPELGTGDDDVIDISKEHGLDQDEQDSYESWLYDSTSPIDD